MSGRGTAVGAEIDHDATVSMPEVGRQVNRGHYGSRVMPVEFLTDEQAAAYGSFQEVPTRPELESISA